MKLLKKNLAMLLLTMAAFTATAQNPLVTHLFTADPSARVHDGRLFVYPSGDKVPDEGHVFFDQSAGFCMPGYHAFSLKGGRWVDHGWILKENDVPWGMKDVCAMWAPDCIEKDGKYYYYYPAKAKNDDKYRRIGVGVADKPEGPFKWEKNYIQDMFGIDPGILVDDKDNKAYIFVKSGPNIRVAPLSDDMKSITQPLADVEGLPAGYKEGPFPIKIKDKYYLIFAHNLAHQGYTIGYAIASKPMGPYLYYGNIMDSIAKDTNHSSIAFYEGRWIFFYHNWALSGHTKLRSMCAEYMTINKDGSIQKVVPTLRGIGTPIPGDTIQIDRYNSIHKATTTFVGGNEPAGWMVSQAPSGSHVIFNDVDFGDGTCKTMQARVACGARNGTIEVRQNTPQGALIAKYEFKYTGGWNSWTTLETDIKAQIKGKTNLCVIFYGPAMVANLNWLRIKPTK